jgi:hypothetical protein
VSGRAIVAVVAAPVCAAIAYAMMVLATVPEPSHPDGPQPIPLMISSFAVTGTFELLVLVPLWYALRGETPRARAALCVLGIAAWFLVAAAIGALLGHGGGLALRFGISLLFPGVVVAAVFAALMPARGRA